MGQPRHRIERIWAGRDVVIVGGGPSLSFEQVRVIARACIAGRCRVIAVNDQVYWCWWADWLHAADTKWWLEHRKTAPRFKGIRTTVDDGLTYQWADGYLKVTGKDGFDEDPTNVRGGFGGYQALHCAIHTGAARVALVGMDSSAGHCHGGHPGGGSDLAPFGKVFASILPAAVKRGCEIVNCSPGSKIECFPVASIEEFLGGAG